MPSQWLQRESVSAVRPDKHCVSVRKGELQPTNRLRASRKREEREEKREERESRREMKERERARGIRGGGEIERSEEKGVRTGELYHTRLQDRPRHLFTPP
jgi:hypothetical protein